MAMRAITDGNPKALSDEDFESVVRRLRDDARDWIDKEVAPSRERAWKYYHGKVDKTVDAGRSKGVLTEVRDATESVMVSLMRVFLSTNAPVEFEPTGPEDVELAKQQTAAASHVFYKQNPGWRILNDAFRDGLVAKTACIKVWWDPSVEIEESVYEGLDETEFAELASDPDVEVLEFSVEDDADADISQVAVRTFSAKIRREHDKGQVRVASVPSEELIFSKMASDCGTATIIGQDGTRKAQDIVNEGLATWKDIEIAGTVSEVDHTNLDERSERSGIVTDHIDDEDVDPASAEVRVGELYVRLDRDGDGTPELHRVIMLGDKGHVASSEVWDRVPLFVGSPIPLPHTIMGLSLADLTIDLQDISTSVQRAMMDSLYAAVNPRYTAVQNQVNIPELARNRFNDVIRVRQAGAVAPLAIPFVGRDALPVLDYMDQRKEQRTGVSKASLGLDPDALQSSSAIGVSATLTAAQAKVESVARAYAEQLLVPAFKEINRLLAHYQERELIVRMRGEYVPILTDGFNVDLDVTPRVGLGRGTHDEKLAFLTQVLSKQEQILTTAGMNNPVVSLAQYSNTLHDMIELSPLGDGSRYFSRPEEVAAKMEQMAAQAAQSPQQDPEAQAKAQKLQADMQLEQAKAQAKIQLERELGMLKMELEREKAAQDIQLQREKLSQELELKRQELLAEIQLEKMQVEQNPGSPGAGNIPGST